MTVKELKEILDRYPDDMLVKYARWDAWGEEEFYDLLTEEEIVEQEKFLAFYCYYY